MHVLNKICLQPFPICPLKKAKLNLHGQLRWSDMQPGGIACHLPHRQCSSQQDTGCGVRGQHLTPQRLAWPVATGSLWSLSTAAIWWSREQTHLHVSSNTDNPKNSLDICASHSLVLICAYPITKVNYISLQNKMTSYEGIMFLYFGFRVLS